MTSPGKTDCITDELLKELIAGTLRNEDEQPLIEHLNGCGICRRKLDDLHSADEYSTWLEMNPDRSEPVPEVLQSKLMELDSERTMLEQPVGSGGQSAGSASRQYADVAAWLSEPVESGDIGQLGDFRVIDFLGRGGMGIVFKAFDTRLDRPVALKLMSPALLAEEDAGRRFLSEAKSVAAINHPNVVTIHSVHDSADLPFLVMEYVDGVTLQRLLRTGGTLDVLELADITRQIASGLAAAHAAHVVHRDIKPGNILIEAETGRVVVGDFGLARATDSATLTSEGSVAGTLSFLAPERVDGLPADHRSDLFSLGSLIYLCATGELPFESDNIAATLHRIREVESEPLEILAPDLPSWVAELVRQLHQLQPASRMQSAALVVAFLDEHVQPHHSPRVPHLRVSNSTGSDTHVSSQSRTEFPTALQTEVTEHSPADRSPQHSGPTWRTVTGLVVGLIAVGTALYLGTGWGETETQDPETHAATDLENPVPDDRHPFAVRSRNQIEVFPSLEQALSQAEDGATIEIHSDGPFVCSDIQIDVRQLTITAASGHTPVLLFRPEHNREDVFLTTDSPLTLIGLELRYEASPRLGIDHATTLIVSLETELYLADCRLINPYGLGIAAEETHHLQLIRCGIGCPSETALEAELGPDGHLEIENSVLVGDVPLKILLPHEDSSAEIYRTTFFGIHALAVDHLNSDSYLSLTVRESLILSVDEALLIYGEPEDDEELSDLFHWEGSDNLWLTGLVEDQRAPLIGLQCDDELVIPDWSPESIEEWNGLPAVDEDNSRFGSAALVEQYISAGRQIEAGKMISIESLPVGNDQHD
ncbi:MAG: serine/threonine-protein kinase [Planctomycetaceae bacterium]